MESQKQYTAQDIRELLGRYQSKINRLMLLYDKLDRKELQLECIKNINSDLMMIDTEQQMTRLLNDKIDIEQKIELYENQSKYLKYKVLNIIDVVQNDLITKVLKSKYIDGMKCDKATEALSISTPYFYKLQAKGVQIIADRLNNGTAKI